MSENAESNSFSPRPVARPTPHLLFTTNSWPEFFPRCLIFEAPCVCLFGRPTPFRSVLALASFEGRSGNCIHGLQDPRHTFGAVVAGTKMYLSAGATRGYV